MFHFTAAGKGRIGAIPRQSPRLSPATGIESRCEQSSDLVLAEWPRFDPTVLDSLPDILRRRGVRDLIEFRLNSAGNPDSRLDPVLDPMFDQTPDRARLYALQLMATRPKGQGRRR